MADKVDQTVKDPLSEEGNPGQTNVAVRDKGTDTVLDVHGLLELWMNVRRKEISEVADDAVDSPP